MRLGALIARAVSLLTITSMLACGGGGGDGAVTPPPPPPPPPTVATVEMSQGVLDLTPGQGVQLRATPRTAAGVELTDRSVSWSTASPSVAIVSASGLVTGVADGSTSVTATSDGRTGVTTVNVRTAVASVLMTPVTAQATVGGTPVQLTATPVGPSGASLSGRQVVWSSSNNTIASVSQTGLVTGVAQGTATISATSEGRTGTAAITVLSADPCQNARTMSVGQTLAGTLVAADCRLSDQSALQYYTFTLATAATLEIEMTSAAVDPYLFVLDAGFKVLAEDDDGGAGNDARVLRFFPAGKYFIAANAYQPNSFGAFQLAVRPAPAACVSGRPTSIPAGVNGGLAATTSCRLNDDSYFDLYDLSVPARTTVRVDLTSSAIDPFIVMYDATGKLVAQDDDGGDGLNARFEAQVEPGRYSILASAQPRQLGLYRLDVAVAVDPCAVSRTIAIGGTFSGSLGTADCAVSSRGPTPYTQRFLLNVSASTPLQIDMTSGAVDAYLVIQNATTGAIVAENDDVSSTSTNARIAANFPAGQYIVNATTYENGEIGAYTLTVRTIVPTTPVTLSVSPSSLDLVAGQEVPLIATVTGNTNTAVTWSSSATATATVSPTGVVRGGFPGETSIQARSVADPSKFVNIPVRVTQSASAAPNLDIAAVILIQSVQQLDGSIPLVANRDAVARIFLRGSRLNIPQTPVRVRLYQGTSLLQTLQATIAPTPSVDEACCSANILIPGSLVRAGMSILVDADPLNIVGESNESDNMYPVNGTPQPLNVVTVPDFNVRLVPVRQNRAATTGVATTTVTGMFQSIWPVSVVNATARVPFSIDYALVSSSFEEWSFLVRDIELARRTEGFNGYYYGLVRVTYTSGVLGLAGGIPALSAVGLDEGSSFGPLESRATFAHEMGHTMGLRHAPCGGAAGPDPAYPFADARTGAFGMDIAGGNLIKLPTGTDIMSYCENQWVSVYNYRNVLSLRARNPNGVPATLIGATPTSVLMVSGSVDARGALIDGAFGMNARPSKSDPTGRFVLEGFGADGKLLFAHRFSPFAVSDGRVGDEAFVVGVPVSDATGAAVARVAVREVDGTRGFTRTKRVGAGPDLAADAAVSVTGMAGAKRLQWTASRAPMVLVRDPRSGEVLGVGRSGSLDLAQFGSGREVEVHVSDGVTSVRRSVNTTTGAIRQ